MKELAVGFAVVALMAIHHWNLWSAIGWAFLIVAVVGLFAAMLA